MRPQITIEIHDVTPAAHAEIETIRGALHEIGVHRPTLLVVPAFEDASGRRWDLRDAPRTAAWLREEEARGAELILHGLTHKSPGPPPLGFRNWFMHHWFSRGCAEFAHLTAPEATARLTAGRQILDECGLQAEGFIAPAWQQSPAALQSVASQGFRFTAFFGHVMPLIGVRRPVRTPVLTFAAAEPWIDHTKRLFMRAVESMAGQSLLRVALHPEDVHGARPIDHVITRISELLQYRRQVTYRSWLSHREAVS